MRTSSLRHFFVIPLVTCFLLLLGLQASAQTYCQSGGNSVYYEWIQQVSINGESHNSGSNGGYLDASSPAVAVGAGTLSLTLQPGFRSSSYTEYWKVWVDLNQDGTFSSSEVLYSGSSRSTVQTSIVIPQTFTGETRMRVSMRYGTAPPACGSFSYGEVEDYTLAVAAADSEPPVVTSVSPANNQSNVPINTSLMASFSENVVAAQPLDQVFTVVDLNQQVPVAGTVTLQGSSLVFTPDVPLDYDVTYQATVSTDIQDAAGNPMQGAFSWQFVTEALVDLEPPQLESTQPLMDAQGVAVNTQVSASFSEALDANSITSDSIVLSENGVQVAGTVQHVDNTVTFVPSQALAYDTTYQVQVSADIADLSGNQLGQAIGWSFTTGIAPDTQPPVVTNIVPGDGAVDLPVGTAVTVTFSEAMEPSSVTTASLVVKAGSSTAIQGTVGLSGNTAVFTPLSPLDYNTTYTVDISSAATDLAGNPLDAPYSSSFTTEPGYVIQGTVYVDGSGLQNATVDLSGAASGQVVTDISGHYEFDGLAPGNYTLSVAATGVNFTSATQAVSIDSSDVAGVDFSGTVIAVIKVPEDYPTIQQAIDAAADNTTILVNDGVYSENIDVTKSLTIKSVNGYEYTTVSAPNPYDHVFQVSAPNVVIEGFDVWGAYYSRAGIFFGTGADGGKAIDNRCGYEATHRNYTNFYIYQANNVVLDGNICEVDYGLYGIRVEGSSGSVIKNNVIANQGYDAIYVSNSDNTILDNNDVQLSRYGIESFSSDFVQVLNNNCDSNTSYGIYINQSSNATLTSNDCNSNASVGVYVAESAQATITQNTFSNNQSNGLSLYHADNATISNNTLNSNSGTGLYVNSSVAPQISQNTVILNNSNGIYLNYSDGGSITGNIASYDGSGGLYLYASNSNVVTFNTVKSKITGIKRCQITVKYGASGNVIYGNTFDMYQGEDVCSSNNAQNQWYSSQPVSYEFGGNSYSSPIGNYYSYQTPVDGDGDGIGDTPYTLPGIEPQDLYPLSNPIADYMFP